MKWSVRRCAGSLLLCLSMAAASPVVADTELRQRVALSLADALTTELAAGAGVDLNLLSSSVYPLANYWRATGDPAARQALQGLVEFLAATNAESLDCGLLADVLLSGAVLRQAGLEVDEPVGVESRIMSCARASPLFDLANMLLFVCRYTDWDTSDLLPDAMRRLVRVQRADGAFLDESGRASYYLASHAMAALHFCGGSRELVEPTRAGMVQRLARFRARGFNDGVAETLVFLRWTGGLAPGYAEYLAYLKGRVRADSGICFVESPGCESDWHATSLLLELLNFEASDQGFADVAKRSGTP